MAVCTSPSSGYFSDSFTFLYRVSPGDATLDLSYSFSSALVVPNATEVVDESGAVANTTLPAVGSALSVTGGKVWQREGALAVDTSNVVLYVTSMTEDGVYYAGDSILLKVESTRPLPRILVCPLGVEKGGVVDHYSQW